MSTIKAPSTASFRRFGVRNTPSERFCVVVSTTDATAILDAGQITNIPRVDKPPSTSVFPVTGETITHKRDGARVLTRDGAEGVAIVLGLPAGVKARAPKSSPVVVTQTAPVVAPVATAPDETLARVADLLGTIMGRLDKLESPVLEPVTIPTVAQVKANGAKRAADVLK